MATLPPLLQSQGLINENVIFCPFICLNHYACNFINFKLWFTIISVIHVCFYLFSRFCEFKELTESERHFCTNCGLMLLPGEQKSHEGQGHTVRSNISDKMLAKPTELFTPLENNKTFAVMYYSNCFSVKQMLIDLNRSV
jgi:hypothetical protein